MYIDPNTGGMLFQVLAGLFAGLTGFLLIFSSRIRATIHRVVRYFREKKGSEE